MSIAKSVRLLWVCFFLGIFLWSGCGHKTAEGPSVCFDRNCYSVELAQDAALHQKGLQFRESLKEQTGMLFIFPTYGQHAFWMKDTWIPLDMIWLDHGQRVVHIEANVPPCPGDPCPSYRSAYKALYVLEVNAGESTAVGIQVGDRAEFHL